MSHVEGTRQEVAKKQAELNRINEELARFNSGPAGGQNATLAADLQAADMECRRLAKELEETEAATTAVWAELKKIAADFAELRSTGDPAGCVQALLDEREVSEVIVARSKAFVEQLMCEQVAAREAWNSSRGAHENARTRLCANSAECARYRAERDDLRFRLAAVQDDISQAQSQGGLLELGNRVLQTELACLEEQNEAADRTLSSSTADLDRLEAQARHFEAEHQKRRAALEATSSSWNEKAKKLDDDLVKFQEAFAEARAARECSVSEDATLREEAQALQATQFKLQTERLASSAELEHTRRRAELMSWDHYNIQRDMLLLAERYSVVDVP